MIIIGTHVRFRVNRDRPLTEAHHPLADHRWGMPTSIERIQLGWRTNYESPCGAVDHRVQIVDGPRFARAHWRVLTSTIDSAIVSTVWAETRNRPPFLGTGTPALSWQVLTDEPNWLQAESEIEVRLAGVVAGRYRGDARSQNVPWPAEPLTAYDSAEVRVRVRGGARSAWSEYSAWLTLRTGPLGAADWTAPFIAAQTGPDEVDGVDHHDSADPDLRAARPTVRFRTPVTLDAAVEIGRAHV